MTNKQLIKYAHVFAVAAILACGLMAIVAKASISLGTQNQNQNQNQNGNQNGNTNTNTTGNANRSQNQNTNMSGNRNSRDTGARGDQTGMRSLSSQDRNFVMEAAMANMTEIELGRLATERAASDAVKQFGQRMVDDHTAASNELMTWASGKGITLPTTLDEKHRAHVTRLSGLSGAEFDRAFVRMMVTEHNKAVNLFEKQNEKGADADLKAFAAKTLPALQEHHQMARALPGAPGGNDNSNTGGTRNSNRNMNGNTNRNMNGNSNNSNRP